MNRKSFLKTSALGFGALFQIPFTGERIHASELEHAFSDSAESNRLYDTLIIGGSFAGLSAAMGLGRCRRSVLVIDEGLPRNRTSPQANNLFSRDGQNPAEILSETRKQLTEYQEYLTRTEGLVTEINKNDEYTLLLQDGREFRGKSIVFAGGVTDNLLDIPGLEELWGNGVYHCPYCHGWENRDKKTVVIGTGTSALGLASTVSNWTKDITYYSQGEQVDIPEESKRLLTGFGVELSSGTVTQIAKSDDGSILISLEGQSEPQKFETCYAPGRITANSSLAEALGCEMRPNGAIVVNERYETEIEAVYAIGDICSRSNGQVIHAAYSGTVAAATINNMFLSKRFES